MYESLGKAATAAGVSKSTILRAIKAHRISAVQTDIGDWTIDPAELHRVFPPVRTADRVTGRGETATETALTGQIEALRQVSELLRRQLDDVRADRDEWRTMAQATTRLLPAPKTEVAPPAPPAHWAKRAWRWSRG
jgi:hypothetical protein